MKISWWRKSKGNLPENVYADDVALKYSFSSRFWIEMKRVLMFNTNDPSGQSDKSHFTFPECNTKTSSLFVVNESRCVFENTHLGIFLFKLKCKQPSWRPAGVFYFPCGVEKLKERSLSKGIHSVGFYSPGDWTFLNLFTGNFWFKGIKRKCRKNNKLRKRSGHESDTSAVVKDWKQNQTKQKQRTSIFTFLRRILFERTCKHRRWCNDDVKDTPDLQQWFVAGGGGGWEGGITEFWRAFVAK